MKIDYMDLNINDIESPILNVDTFKTSLKNIISTQIGDIAGFPEFSMNPDILFENFTPIVVDAYKTQIISTVNKFDPRIIIESIEIKNKSNSIILDIKYNISSENIKDELEVSIN